MKRLYLITCLLLLCACTHAQTAWNKIYDFCPDTTRNSDNHAHYADDDVLVVAGHTASTGISDFHSYIATLDYNGNVVGSKMLYSPGKTNMIITGWLADTKGNPVTKVSDNKYVLAGAEWDKTANSKVVVYQPFFYFFNKNCDSLLQVKYKDTLVSHIPLALYVDDQKNIIVTGTQTSEKLYYDPWGPSYDCDSYYIWVAKYDSNANLIWSNKYLPAYRASSQGYKIIPSHDKSSYYLAGMMKDPIKSYHGILMKIDLSGNVIWSHLFNAGRPDIVGTSDNNYAFIGTSTIPSSTDYLTYYGKFDDAGDTIWTKKFRHHPTGDIIGHTIHEAENGDLLLFSDVYLENKNELIRTTPKGNIKWYREYAHIKHNQIQNVANFMSYTPTKQVFLSGHFYSNIIPGVFDSVGRYSWFVLTDTFGCIEPGCQVGDTVWWLTDVNEIATRPVDVTLYPNPATNIVYIQTGNTPKKLNAVLHDMSGRALSTTPLQSNGKTPVDITNLPQGLYMMEVWDEEKRIKVFKVEHY